MPYANLGECIEWDSLTHSFHPNRNLLSQNPFLQNAQYYDEAQIRKMSSALFGALDYLHSELNVVHRDIKPSNIMLDLLGNPIIVDFGKAKQLKTDEEDCTTSMEGTYTFLPPESC